MRYFLEKKVYWASFFPEFGLDLKNVRYLLGGINHTACNANVLVVKGVQGVNGVPGLKGSRGKGWLGWCLTDLTRFTGLRTKTSQQEHEEEQETL